MVKVISGLKNTDLEQALAGDLCVMPLKTRKEYRNAVREALKKPVFVPQLDTHSVQNCQLRSQQQSDGISGFSTELVMKTDPKSAPAGRTLPLTLLVVRVYVDSPGGESSRVEGYMFLCPNRNEPPTR